MKFPSLLNFSSAHFHRMPNTTFLSVEYYKNKNEYQRTWQHDIAKRKKNCQEIFSREPKLCTHRQESRKEIENVT